MKTYKNLFPEFISRDNIQKAFLKASEGKRDRDDVREILENLEYHVELLRVLIIDLVDGKIEPRDLFPRHRTEIINEGTGRKPREIIKPNYRYEQVIHHMIVQVIQPIISRGMSEFCAGSVPGRGSHYVLKHIKKWRKHDAKNMKYAAQLDIKSFFKSVSKKKLKEKLARIILDSKLLFVIFCVINSCKKGLPLGYFTSQWFSIFFLQDLDHFIKNNQRVKVGNRYKIDYSKGCGISHFIRYADDILLFGPNKRELHKAVEAIRQFLKGLGLKLKDTWQVFRTEYKTQDGKIVGRALDFIGYVFHHDRIVLRKPLMLRISAKARRIGNKAKATWYDACGMISYIGYVTHTNCYNFYLTWVKPHVCIRNLKKIVSKHARKENMYARLAGSTRFLPRTAFIS